jgi:flagellar biosynthesis protein FlhG
VLGVAPGAGLEEVRCAYQRQRDLWGEGSLATYSLLEEGDRAALLAEVEAAWERVRRALETVPEPAAAKVAPPPAAELSLPDPAVSPGAYLRAHRLRRGMTLEQVAVVTKIHPSTLDRLEREELHLMPPPVYVRGFVIQFARTVGVDDPEGLAARFLARLEKTLL